MREGGLELCKLLLRIKRIHKAGVIWQGSEIPLKLHSADPVLVQDYISRKDMVPFLIGLP